MATVAEQLVTLYAQRADLLTRIAAAGSTPLQVAVTGSVSYQERSVGELREALRIIEETIATLENPSGLVRVLPRYY